MPACVSSMLESLTVILDALPYIAEGGVYTLLITWLAIGLGMVLGIPMAVGIVYGPAVVQRIIGLYVWFFRGVPILVLMFLFYFGIFPSLGLDLEGVPVVAVVLGLTSAAYQSQIVRGAIQSLPQGQLKAARALGMSDAEGIRSIILPQALRLAIPGWSNEYSILLKDSALAYVVGAQEIFTRTHFVASRTYEHLPLYILAGILYLLITLVGLKLLLAIEKKVRIPGYTF